MLSIGVDRRPRSRIRPTDRRWLGLSFLLTVVSCTQENPRFVSDDESRDAASDEAPTPDHPEVIGDSGGQPLDEAPEPPEGPEPQIDADQTGDAGIAEAPPTGVSTDGPELIDLTTGLIGYWKFDEASGATTAVDSSGAGNDGTLENITPTKAWVPGHRGGALKITATPFTAGVRVARTPLLDGLKQFTIAAWVYQNGGNLDYQTVLSRQIDNVDAEVFNLTFFDQHLTLYLAQISTAAYLTRAEATTPLARWVHVAATFDGAVARIYNDGVQAGTLSYKSPLAASTMPLYIGTNKNTASMNQPLQGMLDDVLLYSVALSPAAIAALAGGAVPAGR